MTYLISDGGVVYDCDPSCVDRKIAADQSVHINTRLATTAEAQAFFAAAFLPFSPPSDPPPAPPASLPEAAWPLEGQPA